MAPHVSEWKTETEKMYVPFVLIVDGKLNKRHILEGSSKWWWSACFPTEPGEEVSMSGVGPSKRWEDPKRRCIKTAADDKVNGFLWRQSHCSYRIHSSRSKSPLNLCRNSKSLDRFSALQTEGIHSSSRLELKLCLFTVFLIKKKNKTLTRCPR